MRCYGYIPLSARHGGSHPDAQVGKVDLAPRGYRRQLHILTELETRRHFLPIRNVMPSPRLHPAIARKPGVPSLWSRNIRPLLMMCIGTSDELRRPGRAGRENGRVLRTCSQTYSPDYFPTPCPSRLISPCSCFLAAPRFRTLVVDLFSHSPCLANLRRPEGLG